MAELAAGTLLLESCMVAAFAESSVGERWCHYRTDNLHHFERLEASVDKHPGLMQGISYQYLTAEQTERYFDNSEYGLHNSAWRVSGNTAAYLTVHMIVEWV